MDAQPLLSGPPVITWLREMQNRVPESYLWDHEQGLEDAAAYVERLVACASRLLDELDDADDADLVFPFLGSLEELVALLHRREVKSPSEEGP